MNTLTQTATSMAPWIFLGLCVACFASSTLLSYTVDRIQKTSWESLPQDLKAACKAANWVREYIANQDPVVLPEA